jgi:hypothetical protein
MYRLNPEDVWRKKIREAELEQHNLWHAARLKQLCRDGQAQRLQAKVKPPSLDEV